MASKDSCGKIIAAHTIQRRRTVEGILDDEGHCLGFYPRLDPDPEEPRRFGWHQASTFSGFCIRHDGPTFAPLENAQFTGTNEQCFLLAYRAECHELYQKQAASAAGPVQGHLLDRGLPPEAQHEIQRQNTLRVGGFKKGLDCAKTRKSVMDECLLSKVYSQWDRLFIRFSGTLSVVTSGVITPTRSLDGNLLQVLHDELKVIQALYVSVVNCPDGGAIVLTWKKDEAAPARFVAGLAALPFDAIASAMVQTVFAYIENTYFSKSWWMSLRDHERSHLRDLAIMGNPYYEPWGYLPGLTVPWRILYVCNEWKG